MAVDFGILAQTPTIGARYAEGLQLAQVEQERNMLRAAQMQQMRAQQENMLAQREDRKAQAALRGQQELELKTRMERAARNEKLLSGLGDLLQQNGYKLDRPTLGRMAQVSTQVGDAAGAKVAMEGLRALDEREALQAAFGGQAAPAAAPSMMRQPSAAAAPAAAPTNMFAGTPFDIGTTQPAPVNALAVPSQPAAPQPAAPAAGGMSRERLQAIILDPNAPKAAVERAKAVLESLPKPDTYAPASEIQQYNLAVEQGFQGTIFDFRRKLAEASRAPREPKGPGSPVAVVDEATGRVKYVTAEEAIGKTPASAMEGLAPKEIQRREAVFPQAKQSVATVTSTMTEVENTIDRLLKNPKGLNGITGLVYGRTPALTDDARRAESDIKQLRNLAFVQGLTELRAASKTGAGVGNVSNKEGDRFENLKASLETTQSFDDMVAALKRLKAQTSATKTNLQTEFEDMYSYRQGRQTSTAPAAGASPYQNLSNEELLRQLGVKPGGR